MNKIFTLLISLVLILIIKGHAQGTEPDSSSLLFIDHEELVSRADLVYDRPVRRSEDGMPVGNGRMGSLVWTTPTAFRFQINRVDVFANSSATNNFYERHTDYYGGVGFVDVDFVDFGEEVFREDDFHQQLSVYNGTVYVEGKGVKAEVLVWHEQDVMVIRVTDNRPEPSPVQINLRMLRPPVVRTGDHTATIGFEIADDRIMLNQVFEEDEHYNSSAIVIGVSGRDMQTRQANETEIRLTAAPGNNTFSIYIATAAGFDPEANMVEAAGRKLDAAIGAGYDAILESNQNWWHDFWSRSFMRLHSADGKAGLIERYYTYYLYVMGSSSRGAYPVKFNGMLWSTGGDQRQWGSLFWGANQSCLYNALYPANRMELIEPVFSMFTNMVPSAAAAARQQWNSEGIYLPETYSFDGIPELPEDIAGEMQALYLMDKTWEERSVRFREYAYTKMPHHSRWNWKQHGEWEGGRWRFTDKGAGPFGHVNHIFSHGAKIAYQYWQKYEYTLDEEWLRSHAWPMVKGMAEFYRTFPNLRKEADGNYHIFHVNDNESVWDAQNTVEEISSMMGIFPVAIRASEILDLEADKRFLWQEILDNLAPIPTNEDHATPSSTAGISLSPGSESISTVTGAGTENLANNPVIWARALGSSQRGNPAGRPDHNTMPPWFFDLVGPESGNHEIANATFDAYFPKGIDNSTRMGVLSKLAVAGTKLGRPDAVRYLIPNQILTAEIEPLANLMDLREGHQTTSIQRLGRIADALHHALLQSTPPRPAEDPVIHVFAAWPQEWEAAFTLLARGNFLITSSVKVGETEFVEVLSQAGAEFRLRNPWPEREVTVYRNGREWKNMRSDLITFPTKKQNRYVIVMKGNSPEQFRRSVQ